MSMLTKPGERLRSGTGKAVPGGVAGGFAGRIHAVRPYSAHVPRTVSSFVAFLREALAGGFDATTSAPAPASAPAKRRARAPAAPR